MKRVLVSLILAFCIVAGMSAIENILIDGIYYSLDTKKRTAGISYEEDYEEFGIIPDSLYGSIHVDTLVIPATVTYKKRSYRVLWGDGTGLQLIDKPHVRTLVIGENVEVLSDYCLDGFINAQTVIINSSKLSLSDTSMPESVHTVIFGENVSAVSPMLCTEMLNLKTVVFPKKLSVIGAGAFAECPVLANVVLPEQLYDVDNDAFIGCYSLENLTLPPSIKSFAAEAFSGVLNVNDERVKFVFAHGRAYGWTEEGQMVYDTDEHNIPEVYGSCTVNGYGAYPFAYADSCKFELLGCSPAAGGAVVIPNSVKYIGPHVFDYCRGITYVSVPDSVQVIEEDAFAGVKEIHYRGTLPGAPWGAKAVVADSK